MPHLLLFFKTSNVARLFCPQHFNNVYIILKSQLRHVTALPEEDLNYIARTTAISRDQVEVFHFWMLTIHVEISLTMKKRFHPCWKHSFSFQAQFQKFIRIHPDGKISKVICQAIHLSSEYDIVILNIHV